MNRSICRQGRDMSARGLDQTALGIANMLSPVGELFKLPFPSGSRDLCWLTALAEMTGRERKAARS